MMTDEVVLVLKIYLNLSNEQHLRCEISATGAIISILCGKLKICEINIDSI